MGTRGHQTAYGDDDVLVRVPKQPKLTLHHTAQSNEAFQRHAFSSITSHLVPNAMAVARPRGAKQNPCNGLAGCVDSDFPLFAFVSSDLAETRTWENGLVL